MFLHQMRTLRGELSSQWLAIPRMRITVMLVVRLARMIQLALVREHFAEQFSSGLVFLGLALLQLNLAVLLALRPGPAVYRVGLNLWLSARMRIAGVGKSEQGRAGLLAVRPSGIAAPVCCSASPPRFSLFGVPLALDAMAAPFAVLLSAVLLTFSLVFLRIQFKRATCS